MAPDQLSPHFSLRELTRTTHRNIDNSPPADVLARLRILCSDFLEHLRSRFGPIVVTSGFRCRELNTAIGGATDSAHLYGCAADVVPADPNVSLEQMMHWVVHESNLSFDQVILEHSGNDDWLHLGMLRPFHNYGIPRKEALTMEDGKYDFWRPT